MAYTTIDDPTAHFNTSIWTGNGIAGREIIGVGFQPDFIWAKRRDDAGGQNIFDSSRGVTKRLEAHGAGAEADDEAISAYNSDGFTMNTTTTGVNIVKATYAAWSWKANGGTTTTNDASATSVGTIDSVYQANTTAGFSIVTWTGTGSAGTIAHGLGAVPAWYIVKGISKADGWFVYHHKNTAAPETDFLRLDNTDATTDLAGIFNDTAPTSTVFSVGTDNGVNESSETYIAYCFAEKQGYSKFGSYTGNGNVDGPFYYTGFKPAWLMIKNLASGESWEMWDNARDPDNVVTLRLKADDAGAAASGTFMDFVSNGVKHRNYSGGHNNNGESYIYMAFAASPFVTSNGTPTNAR